MISPFLKESEEITLHYNDLSKGLYQRSLDKTDHCRLSVGNVAGGGSHCRTRLGGRTEVDDGLGKIGIFSEDQKKSFELSLCPDG